MNHDSQSSRQTHEEPASAGSKMGESAERSGTRKVSQAIIVNADDWGRDVDTTDRSLDCVLAGTVSSVSAMMFMEDSERAAVLARQHGIDAGLHLNFTAPYSARQCPSLLLEHQQKLACFLRSNRYALVMYHPGLAASFEYVVATQLEEYQRLYGFSANRLDGHHHMHLCANVLLGKLLPAGTLVRRNFSFAPGEKSWMNRRYRNWLDGWLRRRHRLVDFLFSLAPVEPASRLQRIFSLAKNAVVELETHPVIPEEYQFLTSGAMSQRSADLQVARSFEAGFCKPEISGATTF
jgi:hypothetical protein